MGKIRKELYDEIIVYNVLYTVILMCKYLAKLKALWEFMIYLCEGQCIWFECYTCISILFSQWIDEYFQLVICYMPNHICTQFQLYLLLFW